MNGTSLTTSIGLFAAAFVASAFGVALFTRWSQNRGLFDVPNERSSHSAPTPRGGGLIVVLVALSGYLMIGLALGLPVSWGYLAGAALVAAVSWLDDLYSLPFWSRLIFHVVAAGILMWDVGFWTDLSIPLVAGNVSLGDIAGVLLTSIWVVWLLNAYNFMDGIDGIAGAQALLAGFGWFIVGLLSEAPFVAGLGLLLAAASAGFLLHNWHPARVFMGDAGSGFFGFLFAALPLVSATRNDTLWLCAGLLMWPFLADTAVTLLRRASRGENVLSAHRSHFYQRLVLTGRSHRYVALLYAGLAALGGLAAVSLIYGSTAALVGSITAIAAAALAVWWNVRSREASPGGLDHARV